MTGTRGTKRRAASTEESEMGSDYEGAPSLVQDQSKRSKSSSNSASGSVSANPAVKKQLRMERNRQAAQASRDRRKHYTEELERKVSQLEERLASASSPSSSVAPPPSPSASQVAAAEERVAQLEAENAALRQQLADSQSENLKVQTRMDGMEGKLEWLTNLVSQRSASPSQPSSTSPGAMSPSVSPAQLQQSLPLSPSTSSVSLDPQTLLSLLPPASQSSSHNSHSPLSASSVVSSAAVQQPRLGQSIGSLVARELQFLPRIPMSSAKKSQALNSNSSNSRMSASQWRALVISSLKQTPSPTPQLTNWPRLRKSSPSSNLLMKQPSLTSRRLRYRQRRQASALSTLTPSYLLNVLKRTKLLELRLVSERK